jgi:hypothetical protein
LSRPSRPERPRHLPRHCLEAPGACAPCKRAISIVFSAQSLTARALALLRKRRGRLLVPSASWPASARGNRHFTRRHTWHAFQGGCRRPLGASNRAYMPPRHQNTTRSVPIAPAPTRCQ